MNNLARFELDLQVKFVNLDNLRLSALEVNFDAALLFIEEDSMTKAAEIEIAA